MSGLRQLSRSRPLVAIAAGVLVSAGVIGPRLSGLLQPLELGAYDRFVQWSSPRSPGEVPIHLVQILEEDVRRHGYPLCDDSLARVLDILLEAKPRAIGIDLYRDAPVPCPDSESGAGAAGYERLGGLVGSNRSIVMTTKLPSGSESGTPAPAFVQRENQIGFSDIPVDPGGTIRRSLLLIWQDGVQHGSFALRLALRFLAREQIGIAVDPERPSEIRLGSTPIPALGPDDGGYVGADTGGYQFLLDYARGAHPFSASSLGQLLGGQVAETQLRDRIVILGTAAPSVKDHFYTPFSSAAGEGKETFGVELHGHAADQLIRYARGQGSPMSYPGEAGEAALIAVAALVGGVLGLLIAARLRGALVALALLVGLVGGAYGAFTVGWWLPVVPSVLATALAGSLVTIYLGGVERFERREVTRLFSRFLRPQVAEHIWRQRDQFMEGAQRGRPRPRWATLTTLLADLENYTQIAERMDPLVVMDWVNEFIEAMAMVIEEHDGVVDDYAGDGIKANFGFPVPRGSEEAIAADARNAVRCALEMGRRMEELNTRWSRRDLPTVRLRVGIATGPTVVGVLGSTQSLKYTTVGDTVNTAARLEGFEKDELRADRSRMWRVLVTEETLSRVKDGVETLDLGRHLLRGRNTEVGVFQVVGAAESQAPESREEGPHR